MQSKRTLLAAVETLELRRLLATITVTTATDELVPNDGAVSLREAITSMNAGNALGDADITAQNPGTFGTDNQIHFGIPGDGLHTIHVGSHASAAGIDLPDVVATVTIDGTTQSGFSAATHEPIIELDGTSAASNGLRITGVDSTIRGLVINHFDGNGIQLKGSGNTVVGNYVGLLPDGTTAAHNSGNGVFVDNSTNNRIGGITAADRNVISGNNDDGVDITGVNANFNRVQGNFLGTDKTGTLPLGNGGNGVIVFGSNNTIGGTVPGAGNVCGDNKIVGIAVSTDIGDGLFNVIQGNFVGTDITGTIDLGNADGGMGWNQLASNNLFGGSVAAAANTVAFNHGPGVFALDFGPTDGVRNTIRHNSIYSNKGIGIDLSPSAAVFDDGPNPNDAGDTDSGVNNFQNHPVLESAENDGTKITVTGSLNSLSNQTFLIDLYSSPTLGAYGLAEGKTFLKTVQVTTNGLGNATFTTSFPAIAAGSYISATASDTQTDIYNNTSEFSGPIDVPPAVVTTTPTTIAIGDVTQNEGNSGTTAFTFTVTRSGDLSGGSSVAYTVADGTATTADNDYQLVSNTLAFDPGQASKTITVLVNGDLKFEANETFNVNLSSPAGATLSDASAVGTIVNDDSLPTLSIGDVSQNEGNSGNSSFVFTVTRSGDLSSPASVVYSTADGSAVAGTDYVAATDTISFIAGQATQTITISVIGNTTVEPDKVFLVNLSAPGGATLADAQATGTIVNDDVPPPPSNGKVTIVTDPCDSTKKAVKIEGTDNKDTITVTKSGSSQGKVVVKINGSNKGTFSFSGIILVYGKNGNDNISIDLGISRTAMIFAGEGNDTISAGAGADAIAADGGNDNLRGNAGRDILFGGDGADKLDGGSGDDILVAGGTSQDDDPSTICKLLDEWKRTDKTYSVRVNHILNGGGLNGSVKLNASNIFSSAGAKDSLTGGSNTDLFFAAVPGDVLTDKAAGETVVDVG